MKKGLMIVVILMIMLASSVYAQDARLSYWVTLKYNQGKVTLEDTQVRLASNRGDLSGEPNFFWRLYSMSNDVLEEKGFNFPLEKYIIRVAECVNDTLNGYIPGCDPIPPFIREKEATIMVTVPYYGIGKYIDILNSNKNTILRVSLNQFWDFCGDGVCSTSESYLTCFRDCEEELKVYGLADGGETREFSGYYSTVSGNGPVDVYVSPGLCRDSQNNCVEFMEDDFDINVYVKTDDDIYIQDSGLYNVNVIYEDGNGDVFFETDKGRALITSDSIKVSFSDWSGLPVITKNYIDSNGRRCVEVFDATTESKLSKNCR